jgi:hypothetical protein
LLFNFAASAIVIGLACLAATSLLARWHQQARRAVVGLQIGDRKPCDLRNSRAGHGSNFDEQPEGRIDLMGRSDDIADLIVVEPLHVARGEAFGNAAEPVAPTRQIGDAMIAPGREVEGRLRRLEQPDRSRGLHAVREQAVAPRAEFARRQ